MDKPVNYTREAFLHPLNLAFLIATFTTAFFLAGIPSAINILFSIAFAIELIYIGVVPRLPRFQKYVNLRKFKERNSKFDERKIFSTLNEQYQKKFLVLKHIYSMVKENFSKMPYTSQGILDNINTRIDSLTTSYLLLLESNQRYEQYLDTPLEEKLKAEISIVEGEIEESKSPKHAQVLARRLNILQKRLEKYGAAREKYVISDSQIKTIEDTIRYIYEKSITMTNLEEIEYQMDSLLMDLDDTDSLFRGLSPEHTDVSMLETISRLDKELFETQEAAKRTKINTN
jgi:hypothetical protein